MGADQRFKLLTDPLARTAKINRHVNIKLLKALCRLQGKSFEGRLQQINAQDEAVKDAPPESVIGDIAPEFL